MTWQFGQFVPLRFKHLESELFWEWPGKSLGLYLYMRRYVWRSRQGALGRYYASGLLVTSGYLGTWAAAAKVSKSSISRWLSWMRDKGIINCLVDSQRAGGGVPNVFALGQVYDVPGGGDTDAVELFYLDYIQSAQVTPRIDIPELLDLQHEIQNPGLVLIPRGPVAPVEQGVAQVAQGVAPVEQGVAQVQGSNREVNRESNREGNNSGAKDAPLPPDPEAAWLKESRIKGESDLENMSPEERAKVASPNAPEPPPDPTMPEWEKVMRRGLKKALVGDYTPDDVVNYCQRFYDITHNPPPASNKGNLNWRNGAITTLEAFHGSLFTHYESKGAPMPPLEKQRRVFNWCVDLFFTVGAGYDHISAPTPRSLSGQMASLIGDLINIGQMYGLSNGTGPDLSQVEGWIAHRREAKRAEKKRAGQGGSGATPTDEGIRGPGKTEEENARDRALAERIVAGQAGGET